jgi:hypothetical protein
MTWFPHLVLRALLGILACVATTSSNWAEDELIVLVPAIGQATPVPAAMSSKSDPPRTIDEAFERWYRIAYSITLDSPSGPVPGLGMDNVYDKDGWPLPRIPDPFTYAVMKDPTSLEAQDRYFDFRRAAIRRANLAANSIPGRALERGAMPTDILAVSASRPTESHAIGDYSKIDPASLGTPMVSPGKARDLGMDPKQVPSLPGQPSKTGIEVYWFWHHRCEFCLHMAREWFAFQRVVNETGHKAASINLSPIKTQEEILGVSTDLSALLDLWEITWGSDVEHSKNFLDWTNCAQALGVDGTPVTVFINRARPENMIRLEGQQNEAALQSAIAQVAGWPAGIWPPPRYETTPTGKVVPVDVVPGEEPPAVKPGMTPLARGVP